jgi:hypothetical protein
MDGFRMTMSPGGSLLTGGRSSRTTTSKQISSGFKKNPFFSPILSERFQKKQAGFPRILRLEGKVFLVPAPINQSDSYGRRKSAAREYRGPASADTATADRAAAQDPAGPELRAAEERQERPLPSLWRPQGLSPARPERAPTAGSAGKTFGNNGKRRRY